MKVATIVGARPQFIKVAPVSRALAARGIEEVLVHTGQHYDANMSELFFRELEIPAPRHNLGVGSGRQGAQTGQMLDRVESVLVDERPDWVIVYGDTNSTLAGALAAAKLHVPVAHVEAGLRSFNRAMPEEINRVVTDHLSSLLFAPTPAATEHLRAEGIPTANIALVGDVMYDAALQFARAAQLKSTVLAQLGLVPRQYILVTIHRAENTDDAARLRAIFNGLQVLAGEFPVIAPLHPRTRRSLSARGGLPEAGGLRIIDPVGYLDMTMLEKCARLIATDSGGVQKEAYFHGVPCATLRTETEWVELLDCGWNRLIPPTDAETIARALRQALEAGVPSVRPQLYGRGDAAGLIAAALLNKRADEA